MNSLKRYSAVYKVLVIGDSGVGKTALLMRFCEDNYESITKYTIGKLITLCMALPPSLLCTYFIFNTRSVKLIRLPSEARIFKSELIADLKRSLGRALAG